jgi:hypothetical protein
MALYGPFYHVPDWLYFRRDHDGRAKLAFKTARSWCANLEPRRADALRNPAIRLYAEYLWGYVSAIHGAPLSPADKRACYQHLAGWLSTRLNRRPGRMFAQPSADIPVSSLKVDIPGRERKPL